jgi:putative hemolysin
MRSTAKALKPSRVLKATRASVKNKVRSVRNAIEKFDSDRKLVHFNVANFEPNVSFSFAKGHFIVKTASNGAELEECLKLRFDVFHKEYMNKKRTIGVDIDKLDYACDHLVIFDKRIGKTIGTYRLNSSLYTNEFYSAGEFELGKILELEGNKLELGRACIDRKYRSGVVIALLWRGIAEYISQTKTRVLFGCGSIKTMEPLEIGMVTKHLNDIGALTFDYDVRPTKKFKVKQLGKVLEYIDKNPHRYNKEEVAALIPPLFGSYLKMGAKICGEPALDREFHCIDFLTLVKMDEMKSAVKEKFKV